MSSQESNTSSLQSILFDYDETKDYSPISLNEIKKQTEKCLLFENEINEYIDNESDVSIDIESSESSDENDSEDEHFETKWILDSNHESNPEPFSQNVGPCHNLDHGSTPLDYFSIFWNDFVIEQIVNETNRLEISLLSIQISNTANYGTLGKL